MDKVKFIIPNLDTILADFQQPQGFWQLLLLAVTLFVAFSFSKWLAGKLPHLNQENTDEKGKRSAYSLYRSIFLLTSGLLLWLEFTFLSGSIPVSLLRIIAVLLFGVGVVRLFFYAIHRSALAKNSAHSIAVIERVVMLVVWTWVVLTILGLNDVFAKSLQEVTFTIGKAKLSLFSVVSALFWLFLTIFVAVWLAASIEARLMKQENMDANLQVVFSRIAKFALLTIAVFLGLSMVGIDVTMFGVVFGALFAGIGFGLQKIASNYVSGFIILLDRSLRLGDTINVNGVQGMVMQISTRYTVVRDLLGCDTLVPNETFISNPVQNLTLNLQRSWISTTVQVAYSTDVEHALEILKKATIGVERLLQDPPPISYLVEFASDGINLRVSFWVQHAVSIGTAAVISGVNRNIWRLFAEENISIPFSQREVRVIGWPENTPGSDLQAANTLRSADS